MRRCILDDIDRKILKLIANKPNINQMELAKAIGITQPAISIRLKKLKRMKKIEEFINVDPKLIEIKMLNVEMKVKDPETIYDKAKRCPMIINCYQLDKNEISLIAVGENKEFLKCMIQKHLNDDENVNEINVRWIIKSIKGVNGIDMSKRTEYTPCGDGKCKDCDYYIDNGGECLGCPLTIYYKGKLWNYNTC